MVNPGEEFGRRFANRLINRHVISGMRLGEDLYLTELAIPPAMVGRSLIELALPKRFGMMVVAIRLLTGGCEMRLAQAVRSGPAKDSKRKHNLLPNRE